MSSDEKNLAYKWAKAKNSGSTFLSKKSTPINLEHLQEEMDFWKTKLKNSTSDSREKIIDKLLDLRASQTMAFIENLHEDNHPLAAKKINAAIEHYYFDCLQLIMITKHL